MELLKKILIIFGLCLLLILSESLWHPAIALADIRHHEYTPGEMIYQSRQSLRDLQGRSWQVVLFKRVRSDWESGISLRLVGYPGQVSFSHPDDLVVDTRIGASFRAADQFPSGAPSESVGQYDFSGVLPQLPTDDTVVLQFPTIPATTLKIPVFVIQEWQEII